ncbi:MAG: 50S ribosomal protein L37 [Nitrososphaerales archaeon]
MSNSSDKGPLKGLRQKYGATLRKRYSRIMRNEKRTRRCPSCGSTRFRRESVGIWSCNTCEFKIAGEAYDVATTKS